MIIYILYIEYWMDVCNLYIKHGIFDNLFDVFYDI